MPLITTLILIICNYLPWVAVAVVAALAWRRKKDSAAIFLQAAGAAGLFLLALARWLVINLLLQTVIKADPKILEAARAIMGFLLFVALAAFALGYCLERLARRKPAQVTAAPA